MNREKREKITVMIVSIILMSFAVFMMFWMLERAKQSDIEIGIAFYNMCERLSNDMDGYFIAVSGVCIIDVCDNSTENNSTIGFPFSVVIRNRCIEEWEI